MNSDRSLGLKIFIDTRMNLPPYEALPLCVAFHDGHEAIPLRWRVAPYGPYPTVVLQIHINLILYVFLLVPSISIGINVLLWLVLWFT
jgi:hypothetical protein